MLSTETSTSQRTASETITDEVTSWPGVEAGVGDRGEFGFRLGDHRIGHLHGDRVAHFGFPREVGATLREQGRVGPHPVNRHSTKLAARPIESDADVRDVITLMRLNYERAIADGGGGAAVELENPLPGLYATTPEALSFAPSLQVRAFLLAREAGNLLIYGASGVPAAMPEFERLGGIDRRYLNHGHEAMFVSESPVAPTYVHEADHDYAAERTEVRASFSRRHHLDEDFEAIPTPGHTPGTTCYLWDAGDHRLLFTGDMLHLSDGEWASALLDSSERDPYIESLELIRELDFDVLVPWAAGVDSPYLAHTDEADRHRRIDALLKQLRHPTA